MFKRTKGVDANQGGQSLKSTVDYCLKDSLAVPLDCNGDFDADSDYEL